MSADAFREAKASMVSPKCIGSNRFYSKAFALCPTSTENNLDKPSCHVLLLVSAAQSDAKIALGAIKLGHIG